MSVEDVFFNCSQGWRYTGAGGGGGAGGGLSKICIAPLTPLKKNILFFILNNMYTLFSQLPYESVKPPPLAPGEKKNNPGAFPDCLSTMNYTASLCRKVRGVAFDMKMLHM